MQNLGNLVQSVVAQVPGFIPGLTLDITVNTVNTGIDPATNKPYGGAVSQSRFQASIDKLTEDEKESSVLRVTELKLIAFTKGVIIDAKSTISLIRSDITEKYSIIKCDPVYAGSVVVVNTLYLKK